MTARLFGDLADEKCRINARVAARVNSWYDSSRDKETEKSVTAELTKVGPHGYEHGWKFVGVPGQSTAQEHLRQMGAKLKVEGSPAHSGTGRVNSRYDTAGRNFRAAAKALDNGDEMAATGHFTTGVGHLHNSKVRTPAGEEVHAEAKATYEKVTGHAYADNGVKMPESALNVSPDTETRKLIERTGGKLRPGSADYRVQAVDANGNSLHIVQQNNAADEDAHNVKFSGASAALQFIRGYNGNAWKPRVEDEPYEPVKAHHTVIVRGNGQKEHYEIGTGKAISNGTTHVPVPTHAVPEVKAPAVPSKKDIKLPKRPPPAEAMAQRQRDHEAIMSADLTGHDHERDIAALTPSQRELYQQAMDMNIPHATAVRFAQRHRPAASYQN
jgi:hypothetical protein